MSLYYVTPLCEGLSLHLRCLDIGFGMLCHLLMGRGLWQVLDVHVQALGCFGQIKDGAGSKQARESGHTSSNALPLSYKFDLFCNNTVEISHVICILLLK